MRATEQRDRARSGLTLLDHARRLGMMGSSQAAAAVAATKDEDERIEVTQITVNTAPPFKLGATALRCRPRAGVVSRGCVVLLHGFPDCPLTFYGQMPKLAAAGYDVYAPTLRGYEPATCLPSDPLGDGWYKAKHVAADVVAMLDGLGVARCHLIGHDWGSVVASYLAIARPDRLLSLAVLAVPAHPRAGLTSWATYPRQTVLSAYMVYHQLPVLPEAWYLSEADDGLRQIWDRWSAPGWRPTDAYWRALCDTLHAPGVFTHTLSYYRANVGIAPPLRPVVPLVFAALHAVARLRQAISSPTAGESTIVEGVHALSVPDTSGKPIRAPTLGITGAQDGCFMTESFDLTMAPAMGGSPESRFPGGVRVRRVAGAGHFVQLEKPAEVAAILVDWVTSHCSDSSDSSTATDVENGPEGSGALRGGRGSASL